MIEAVIKNVDLSFETGSGVFSPAAIDRGTLAMLAQVEFTATDKVLDLGCGYGVVGILAARLIGPEQVLLCDIDEQALALSRRNAERNGVGGLRVIRSDGLDQIDEDGFSLILSNPPYHTDFSVPRRFIEQGFRKLAIGGRLIMVTKRKEWYKNKLIAVFGGVRIVESDGYFVFTAEKRPAKPEAGVLTHADGLSAKLRRKQAKMKGTKNG